ncbi:MAG: Beta-hexosaminidase [Chlamydiia bacterium]|nr:Beta-hexosaminidase [Chlamydiia bacterium]
MLNRSVVALFFLMCATFTHAKHIKIEELSVEEKVGQLLFAHFNGISHTKDAEELVNKALIGGIIYYEFSNPFEDPYQVQALSIDLQNQTKRNKHPIPLFISVDQEGGRVARLYKGFTVFPSQKALGETGDPNYAKSCALATAKELKTVGVNMNLAPVVDVHSNDKNPVIGIRSFSSDPILVSSFAKNAIAGYQEGNVMPVIKHFPGHGDTETDSHDNLPFITKSKTQMEKTELFPYRNLKNDADAIMTAHILLPEIDAKYCATLSKRILHDILREQIGFKGLVIADSLVMDGLLQNLPDVNEAALQALTAGCDMLILGGKQLQGAREGYELTPADVIKLHAYLVKAVKSGAITEARINASVERVLAAKEKYNLFTESYPKKNCIPTIVGCKEHKELAEAISGESVKIAKNALKHSMKAITEASPLIVAPESLKYFLEKSDLAKLSPNIKIFYFKDIDPNDREIHEACKLAKSSSCTILCTANAWQHKSQQTLAQLLKETNKPLISLASFDAQDKKFLKVSDMVFTTLSPTISSFNEVAKVLKFTDESTK